MNSNISHQIITLAKYLLQSTLFLYLYTNGMATTVSLMSIFIYPIYAILIL